MKVLYKNRVESFLKSWLPSDEDGSHGLHKAMRYSTLGGGKRLRAGFVYAVGQSYNTSLDQLDFAAAAVEMIHAFSLIHDDLPAIDNDDLRRGRATCHKVFGEDVAILAGDALHTAAFEVLTQMPDVPPSQIVHMVQILAQCVGSVGLIGGETLDVQASRLRKLASDLCWNDLAQMYIMKSGKLFSASLLLGYLTAHPPFNHLILLQHLGEQLGLAFQIQDDLLEVDGHASILGKSPVSDLINGKITSVSLLGQQRAQEKRDQILQDCLKLINQLPQSSQDLIDLCHACVNRDF